MVDSEVTGEALCLPDASGTISSSSATICLCLLSEASSVGDLVTCPLSAESCLWCDGEGATAACSPIQWAGALQSAIASVECAEGLPGVWSEHGVMCVWCVCGVGAQGITHEPGVI